VSAQQESTIGRLQLALVEKEAETQHRDMALKQRESEVQAKENALKLKERVQRKAALLSNQARRLDGDHRSNLDPSDPEALTRREDEYRLLDDECRRMRNELAERDRQLAEAQERCRLSQRALDEERVRGRAVSQTAELRDSEKARILGTASQTIQSLQTLVNNKNEALLRYQQMLERTVKKFAAKQGLDLQQIARLQVGCLSCSSAVADV